MTMTTRAERQAAYDKATAERAAKRDDRNAETDARRADRQTAYKKATAERFARRSDRLHGR